MHISNAVDLWQDQRFRRHFLGTWVNAIGNGLFNLALPLLVLDRTGSLGAMGAAAVATQIPKVFPGPLVGALVDRCSPRHTMIISYLVQASLVLLIPLSAAADLLNALVICLIGYLTNTTDLFARTAQFVAIPRLYGERKGKINATFASAWTSALVVGPAAGGMPLAFVSPDALLIIDSISFLVITALVASIGVPTEPVKRGTILLTESFRAALRGFEALGQ
jgi:MFS family permease